MKNEFLHNEFENRFWKEKKLVCGIDEAGRGPFFGPLAVAGVVLPINFASYLIDDSKKLSECRREKAFEEIATNAWVKNFFVDVEYINKFGINKATESAVNQIVYAAKSKFGDSLEFVALDMMKINYSYVSKLCNYFSAAKGESWSVSIAAASIVAKVLRDRQFDSYTKLFPTFPLQSSKGYGTSSHCNALKNHGKSFMHRSLYCRKVLGIDDK